MNVSSVAVVVVVVQGGQNCHVMLSALATVLACTLIGARATELLTVRDCPLPEVVAVAAADDRGVYVHVRETSVWECQAVNPYMARDECVEANCVWSGVSCVGTTCTYGVVDGRWMLLGSEADRVLRHPVTDDVAYSEFIKGVLRPRKSGVELHYTCPECPLQPANTVGDSLDSIIIVIAAVASVTLLGLLCVACARGRCCAAAAARVSPVATGLRPVVVASDG
jgi:hypothetical protein